MAKRRESYFWTSYSDLMTSLFLVMLVLFVLVIVLLHSQNRKTTEHLEITKTKLEEIRKMEESTKDLPPSYFEYNEKYKKFKLKIKCKFPRGESSIKWLSEKTQRKLIEAGGEIATFLDKHKENQYLVIIEGQASNDGYAYNYELSYQRALNLVKFWKNSGVNFPDNGELQIAGSGDGTLYPMSAPANSIWREPIEEENQRFLVYVIPKNIIIDDKQATSNTGVNTFHQ